MSSLGFTSFLRALQILVFIDDMNIETMPKIAKMERTTILPKLLLCFAVKGYVFERKFVLMGKRLMHQGDA